MPCEFRVGNPKPASASNAMIYICNNKPTQDLLHVLHWWYSGINPNAKPASMLPKSQTEM